MAILGVPRLIVVRRARHRLRIGIQFFDVGRKRDDLNTVLHVFRSLAMEFPARQSIFFDRSQTLLILFALAAREQVPVSNGLSMCLFFSADQSDLQSILTDFRHTPLVRSFCRFPSHTRKTGRNYCCPARFSVRGE